MITHTSDSHQIPIQNKTVKITNFKKIAKNLNFFLQETLHATHLLKLFGKMYKYDNGLNQNCRRYRADMWCGTDAGCTRDGRTDRRSETNIPPNNFVVRGYNNKSELQI